MQRTATAHWSGGLKDGKGAISSQSGVLKDTQYSFSTRFESGIGTNPEELIAAAHAGCFAMALSSELEKLGMKADALDVKATVTLDFIDGKPTITTSHLDLTAKIPGADQAKFDQAAHNAEVGCPISRVLNAKVSLTASLAA
jgi:osmotically inducible protein OsmC